MNKTIGIDISKQTFDVAYLGSDDKWEYLKLANNLKGFKKLEQILEAGDWLSMEASGPYYLPLASYFSDRGFKVSVINPLIIKRFNQASLSRAKTDKKDAQSIASYTMLYSPELWQKESPENLKMRQILTALELIGKQISQTNNQLHAFSASGVLDKGLKKELEKCLQDLRKRKAKLEQMLMDLGFEYYKEIVKLLMSISGIGKKTAIALCMVTHGFKRFDHYKKLISFLGLSPRIYESGTSVKGRAHICKMGNKYVRKLLFMCSLSASRYNTNCIDLYTRLRAKGKEMKVARIAVATKLVKQAMAVVHSGVKYSKTYDRDLIAA